MEGNFDDNTFHAEQSDSFRKEQQASKDLTQYFGCAYPGKYSSSDLSKLASRWSFYQLNPSHSLRDGSEPNFASSHLEDSVVATLPLGLVPSSSSSLLLCRRNRQLDVIIFIKLIALAVHHHHHTLLNIISLKVTCRVRRCLITHFLRDKLSAPFLHSRLIATVSVDKFSFRNHRPFAHSQHCLVRFPSTTTGTGCASNLPTSTL